MTRTQTLTGSSRLAGAWRRNGGWAMAAVPAAIALAMVVYPLAFNIWQSLHVERLSKNDGQFAGLQSYSQLLQFGGLLDTFRTTLLWTVGCLVLQSLIGFIAAVVLDGMSRAASIIRALLLVPWVMPGVAVSAVWSTIYDPISGLLNSVLGSLHLPTHDWLGDPKTALASLVLVNVWKGFPFWMLMLAAGLKSIPQEVHEAAALDGAGYLKRVRFVIVPMLRPVWVLTTLLAFIWTFNYFDLAYVMTNGGPNGATTILAFDIYQSSFVFNRFDQGSALSVLTFLTMSIAIAVYFRASRRLGGGAS